MQSRLSVSYSVHRGSGSLYRVLTLAPLCRASALAPDMLKLVQVGCHCTGIPPLWTCSTWTSPYRDTPPTNTHTDMLILVHYEARTVNQRVIAIWLKCLLVLRSVNSHDVHLQQIWSLRSKISLSTTKVKSLSKELFVMQSFFQNEELKAVSTTVFVAIVEINEFCNIVARKIQ